MNQLDYEQVRKLLADVPAGAVRQTTYNRQGQEVAFCLDVFPDQKDATGKSELYALYPGVTLSFFSCLAQQTACTHPSQPEILEIHYCRKGPAGWRMQDGSTIYLSAGDCSIHTRRLCAGCQITFPNGYYQGLSLTVDLQCFPQHLPELLREAGITGTEVYQKYCQAGPFTTISGDKQATSILEGFFDLPPALSLAYYKLRFQELLLYLDRADGCVQEHPVPYRPDQIEIARQIHDLLTEHLDQRITIDTLSRRFLMNPSTLKALFKAVYGNSIARHIKEHRMERAALLLRDTSLSVGQISEAVGYESQSKFSAEFRKTFQTLPSEYRRLHG